MDARHFDSLARSLSTASPRRGLLALLASLPLLGGLFALLDADEAEARKNRRKTRKKPHKRARRRRKKQKQRKKKQCKAHSRAKTCANRCGVVKNNCKKKIDCGSCDCGGSCPVCQTCNDRTGVCEPDPAQTGDACGEPGQICQPDGACACDETSCAVCETCQGDGTCSLPCGGTGCCDGTICQDGDTNTACGRDGEACAPCSGPGVTCGGGDPGTPGVCGCTPTTCSAAGAVCGTFDDGCGGMLDCGTCPGSDVCFEGACVCGDVCATGCRFTSVQAAINNLPAGSTIRLCAGVYLEHSIAVNKDLTLIGAGDGDNATTNTILDANLLGPVLIVNSGVTANLQRMRFTRGTESGVFNFHALTMSECTVTANSTSDNGGGIFSQGTSVTLTDCDLTYNTADNGGGAYIASGSLTMTDCLVSTNTAVDNGGISIENDVGATLTRCDVSDNIATSEGGGIYNAGALTLNASHVRDNTAGTVGGVLNSSPFGATVTLTNGSTVCGNSVPQCVGFADAACQDLCPS